MCVCVCQCRKAERGMRVRYGIKNVGQPKCIKNDCGGGGVRGVL